MPVPICFKCEKCKYPIQSPDRQSDAKVICPNCHHENIPPKGYTLDTANVWVKERYFGD